MMQEIIKILLNYEEVGMDMLRSAKIHSKLWDKVRSPLDERDSPADGIEFCRTQLTQIRDMINRVRAYRPTVTIKLIAGNVHVVDCPEEVTVDVTYCDRKMIEEE